MNNPKVILPQKCVCENGTRNPKRETGAICFVGISSLATLVAIGCVVTRLVVLLVDVGECMKLN